MSDMVERVGEAIRKVQNRQRDCDAMNNNPISVVQPSPELLARAAIAAMMPLSDKVATAILVELLKHTVETTQGPGLRATAPEAAVQAMIKEALND